MAIQVESGAPRSRSVFVGRHEELLALDEAMEQARTGRPSVVLIEGPAGIGKTALVDRFLAGVNDVTVLRASGDSSESELAFGVVDQFLRRGGEGWADAWRAGAGADHVGAGARVLDLLGTLQHEHAVVVVLDDAHWADELSLRALLFVVRRLVADRVLAVLLTRDHSPALPEGLTKAAEGIGGRWLHLSGLGTEELRALAEDKGVQLSARGLSRLAAHAGGNPLYTRALLEEVPADVWHGQDNLPAPRSFAEIVTRRVAACSPEAWRLLEAVAVLGPRCPLATAAVLGEVDSPFEALEEACDAELLRRDELQGIPMPVFAHPLIAAAVYDQIGPARRARLHASAAQVIEDEASSLRHLAAAAAGPDTKLANRLAKLAEHTAAGHALQPAALAMVAASRLSAGRAVREERLLRAVDWMLIVGDAAQARAFADEIAGFDDGPRRLSILGQFAELDGQIDEAAGLLAAAWERCDRDVDPLLAATVAHRNAYHALRQLRDEDVVAWARRALTLAPRDVMSVAWAGTLALSLWRLGRANEAYSVLERARTGAEQADLLLRGQRGVLRFADDDIGAARVDLEAAATSELRLGSLLYCSIHLTVLARAQYSTGDWADAAVSAERALALAAETAHPHSAFVWWAVIAVPAARGDWTTAEAYARMAAAEPIDATDRAVPVGMTQALLAAARGDAEAVVSALAPVAALSPNAAVDEPGFWPWQDLYAEALVGLGRPADADAFLRPHEALANERVRASMIAKLARVRGRVEAALGRREPAAAAFVRAVEHIEPLGMPYEEALIRFAHGQFLRRSGRRRAAADELERARDTLARLGARPALERCERELVACGLRPVKRGDNEQPKLTPQEQAVARLVSTGCTNRAVAAELLLSVKTVEVHLTRIYAKLGVRSRAQLAAMASEHPYIGASKE